ncbi:hypothetical protein C8D88_102299 [Lentzea atacamensis]|uniref:DUF8017 domain-containing protein n=1 Tax=Lentzea atacamensis TaxID=531938 RepID=A0A316I892_9PSEU|nr:hypothetical protein [Lentzea atacamensis]PWK89030.1 hypothetical protein C8D88_102299 [Lentzea atacamensis]
MTYPGGGGQGGWNDQQGWGQQQGGDYSSGGYQAGGPPQTGGFPQQGGFPDQGGYPQQGGFPQQGYGQYGGLGVYGGFDSEPPKSKKTLWLVLGAVVLVLLAGGGLTWYLLSRGSGDPNAQNNPTTPTSASSQPTTGACKNEGVQCVETSLGYNYEVPKNWDVVSDARIPIDKFPGISLSAVTTYGDYECEGKPFTKGTNGGALLPKGDINQTATDFTKAVAEQFYASGGTPQVTLTQPKAVQIQHTQKDGKKVVVEGVQVDATITQSANKCLASKGAVKVVVLNGSNKLHALVVNGDLEGGGGGTNPPLPKEAELQKMIDSLVPTT